MNELEIQHLRDHLTILKGYILGSHPTPNLNDIPEPIRRILGMTDAENIAKEIKRGKPAPYQTYDEGEE